MRVSIGYIVVALLFSACIADPTSSGPGTIVPGKNGIVVVNEGVWGQDNATLTYIDPTSHHGATGDYYASANPGLRLGDVANGMTLFDGRGFIPVTGSRTVEAIRIADGVSAGRLRLSSPHAPRSVAILDSTIGCVTSLADSLIVFDPGTMSVIRTIAVGPSPEDVVVANGLVVVANSGYGLFRKDESGAGTLSVVDIRTGIEVRRIPVGPNPRRMIVSGSRLFVSYGFADSLGGVVQLDATTLQQIARWPVRNTLDIALDVAHNRLYVIGDDGVMTIQTDDPTSDPRPFLAAARYPNGIFYSISFNAGTSELCVGLTTGYQPIPGEMLFFGPDAVERGRTPCGIYPGEAIAY